MKKKLFGKADILNAAKIKHTEIRVPEWDDEDGEAWVRIKGWTLAEADNVAATIQQITMMGALPDDWTQQICAISIVDENGDLIFGDGEDGPMYKKLGELSPLGLKRVREEALRINYLTATLTERKARSGKEAPKEVEDSKN